MAETLKQPPSSGGHEILNNLNPSQQAAVKHTAGPLLILAGAGSGKTRVITHRIAYLIMREQAAPDSILAVTFTNKAADEMKERVKRLLGRDGLTGPAGPGANPAVMISTFHAFGARLLRRYADAIGLPRDFVIFDDRDSELLIKKILADHQYDPKKIKPAIILALIERAKDQLQTPDDFAADDRGSGPVNYGQITAEIYPEYEKLLRRSKAVDFADLIYLPVKIIRDQPGVRERLTRRFQHIMVDEYQDTNHSQFMLVYLLSKDHRNLAVVGDDDQAIYGWRGADINNILDFEKVFPETTVVKLEQNYRSTQRILDAAHGVVKNNPDRKEKKLWTNRTAGSPVIVKQVADEYTEARLVLRQIRRLLDAGYKYRDLAVFYRMHSLSRVFEDVFRTEQIPYKVVGGIGFYQRKEIKDILAYLKLIINPEDDISLIRIINEPSRGIGDTTMAKAREASLVSGRPLFTVLTDEQFTAALRPAARTALAGFINLIGKYRGLADRMPVSEMIKNILRDSGYLADLETEDTAEAVSRIENLQELISVAVEFEEKQRDPIIEDQAGVSLREFLMQMALLTDMDFLPEETDYVTLMTLHMAKGLEFSCVFMVAMEQGICPHVTSELDRAELSEERRLCYVGITRAREHLFLSYAVSRLLYGKRNFSEPSQFLDELELTPAAVPAPEDDFQPEAIADIEETPVFTPGDLVVHKLWGAGRVKSRRGTGPDAVYQVVFKGDAVKMLIQKHAKLRIKE